LFHSVLMSLRQKSNSTNSRNHPIDLSDVVHEREICHCHSPEYLWQMLMNYIGRKVIRVEEAYCIGLRHFLEVYSESTQKNYWIRYFIFLIRFDRFGRVTIGSFRAIWQAVLRKSRIRWVIRERSHPNPITGHPIHLCDEFGKTASMSFAQADDGSICIVKVFNFPLFSLTLLLIGSILSS
jgi:hypothetical protein